jgi:hypothetical protein
MQPFLMNIRGSSSLEEFQKEMQGRHFSRSNKKLSLNLITPGTKKEFLDISEGKPTSRNQI